MDILNEYMDELLYRTKNSKKDLWICQLIMWFAALVVSLVVLKWMGINHVLLKSLLFSILDMVPIVGAGLLLIPYVILKVIVGEAAVATGLTILYMLLLVVRAVLDPFIFGRRWSIRPAIYLVIGGIFAGVLGRWGAVLGTILLCVISSLFAALEIQTYRLKHRARMRRLHSESKSIR